MAGKQRLNHAYVVAGGTHVSLAVSRPWEWAPGQLGTCRGAYPVLRLKQSHLWPLGAITSTTHILQVHSDPKALHKPPGGSCRLRVGPCVDLAQRRR